ncbi:chitinase, partial [Listeria monocytogenes]|nr:chitinase [Listeria monocytogenes]
MKKLFSITSVVLLVLSLVVVSIGAEPKRAKAAENVPQYRNVMYYGDWSIWGGEGNFYPKDIPADQLTHLNFAFLDFNSNGDLVFTDKDAAVGAPVGQEGVQWGGANAGVLNAIQDLRAQNPNLKIGVSVGGWSKSGDFS